LRTQAELGSLKITIRKFYRASGSSTQLKGVVPDIILPSINNYAEVGEAALPNALPWDTIPTAKYEPVNLIPPVLPELRKRSDARVDKDKDFAYIREEIERFKKNKDEKTVSMNEEARWKEKKELEARDKARRKELRTRPEPTYKTYEFTLKNVGNSELPDPKTNTLASAKSKLTNEVAIAVTPKEDEDDAPIGSIDPSMDEARAVLQDLVTLTGKAGGLAVKP
jgi:carboxyl-terminal processing protease